MTGPTMPDPARYARRNVAMLERWGYNRTVSAMVVGIACEAAAKSFGEDLLAPGTWLHEVAVHAANIIAEDIRRNRSGGNRTDGGSTT